MRAFTLGKLCCVVRCILGWLVACIFGPIFAANDAAGLEWSRARAFSHAAILVYMHTIRFTPSPAPPPGNSYNDEERVVAAGYDNGDVKIFDLRTNRCFFSRAPCMCACYLHTNSCSIIC